MWQERTGLFMLGFVVLFSVATYGGEGSGASKQEGVRNEAGRHASFRNTLTDSILEGTWQMTLGPPTGAPGKLSDPRPERYTISKVEKAGEDFWIITARIEYADKDVEVPVMVRVVWTEGVPMIVVDDLQIPMIGTYSARVMINRGYYAGTWFGKGYGGVLSGRILKKPVVAGEKDRSGEGSGGQ